MNFSDLPLAQPLLRAAQELGYREPSPIQQRAIPPVAEGKDLLGCAQTGTGKTAAFAMPILQRLQAEKAPAGRPIRALILTPTRELAIQIDDSFRAYGKYLPLRSFVIFGGVNQNPQTEQLKKGVDILTATPGRLNDLIGQGFISLSQVEIFVLDEADRMLDMGFVHDVKKVLAKLPAKRQTLLFSATMPPEIEKLASGMLHDPVRVMVTPPATTVEKISQCVYFVEKANKRYLLADLLKTEGTEGGTLVFTRTKHGADRVVKDLAKVGIRAAAIHGNKSQNARQAALGGFKNGEIPVLVATDIAARGIDISELGHVINYDLPNIPETYVHRIGRTGRAGLSGKAESFCMQEEVPYLRDIEKLTKQKIPVVENHAWNMQPQEAGNATPAASARKMQAPAKAAEKRPQKAAPKPKKEEPNMEEKKPIPAQQGGEQGDAPKKRRHRGGRGRHKKPGAETAARQPQGTDAQARNAGGQPSQNRAQQPKNNRSQDRRENDRNRGAGRSDAPHGANQQARKATHSVSPAQMSEAELKATDVGLPLISRRPPAVKFTSFEDYMASRGLGTDTDAQPSTDTDGGDKE